MHNLFSHKRNLNKTKKKKVAFFTDSSCEAAEARIIGLRRSLERKRKAIPLEETALATKESL